jgi:hypothetical protein
MFGYPSAMKSRFLVARLVEWYLKNHLGSNKALIAKQILEGELDSVLPEAVGDLASYTAKVKQVSQYNKFESCVSKRLYPDCISFSSA